MAQHRAGTPRGHHGDSGCCWLSLPMSLSPGSHPAQPQAASPCFFFHQTQATFPSFFDQSAAFDAIFCFFFSPFIKSHPGPWGKSSLNGNTQFSQKKHIFPSTQRLMSDPTCSCSAHHPKISPAQIHPQLRHGPGALTPTHCARRSGRCPWRCPARWWPRRCNPPSPGRPRPPAPGAGCCGRR